MNSKQFKQLPATARVRAKRWAAPLIIILLGFAVYANSLGGKLIWDDNDIIENNVYIRKWVYLPKIFSHDLVAGAGKRSNFYRPLQMCTYMVDYSLWGLNVTGYHLANVSLHILAALVIYRLITMLSGDGLLSFLTSAFFLVHPVQTEAVAYISGRSDSLAVIFLGLTFIAYISNIRAPTAGLSLLTSACCAGALLSRESSLVLPALIILYHRLFRVRLTAGGFLPVAIPIAIYAVLRLTVFAFMPLDQFANSAMYQRIPGFLVALANYIRLLAAPVDLHMEYGRKLFSITDPRALAGAGILVIMLIYAVKKAKDDRMVSFSIGWFLIALAPVANLYPINAYMAEHFLYLPSIGAFLLLAKGLSSLYRAGARMLFPTVLIAALLAYFSFFTIRQNGYWRDPISFYERTLRYGPDNPKFYNDLGNEYCRVGMKDKAVALYKKSIELNPNHALPYYNLGNVYNSIGEKKEAIAMFEKAIAINPKYPMAYNNLGAIYAGAGKTEKAMALFRKAIAIYPNFAEAYRNLGITYLAAGEEANAIEAFKKAIEINPAFTEAYVNLGNTYSKIGKDEEAASSYRRAIEIDPNHARHIRTWR